MKKRIIVGICLVGVVSIGGVVFAKTQSAPKIDETVMDDTSIQAQPLEKHDLSTAIYATGKVESQNVVVVTTEITTKVKSLPVHLGDYVEKGQTLCTFDDTEIKEQIETMEKQYPEIKQEIEYEKTYGVKGVYSSDNVQTEDGSQPKKELEKLYDKLEATTVRAEQSGIITSLNVSKGSIPNGTLMQIEDDKNLKVKVTIKEKDIIKIKKGMNATITSDALPDEQVTGNITRVINFATSSGENTDGSNQSSGTSYSAEVSLNDNSQFLLGMSAKVEIKLSDSGDILSTPYDSIGTDDKGNSYVYKAIPTKKDGIYKIKKVNVEVGESGDYYTAITSKDLEEGDLIINYPDGVSDGDEVEVSIAQGSTMETSEGSTMETSGE